MEERRRKANQECQQSMLGNGFEDHQDSGQPRKKARNNAPTLQPKAGLVAHTGYSAIGPTEIERDVSAMLVLPFASSMVQFWLVRSRYVVVRIVDNQVFLVRSSNVCRLCQPASHFAASTSTNGTGHAPRPSGLHAALGTTPWYSDPTNQRLRSRCDAF